MREIKFRGINVKNKWTYGSLIKYENEYVKNGVCTFIVNIKSPSNVILSTHTNIDIPATWVNNETVGQYTEIKDKNGKEIYEGDIVECTMLDYEKIKGTIKSTGTEYTVHFSKGHYLMRHILNCKIIGNIYENTELLEDNNDR